MSGSHRFAAGDRVVLASTGECGVVVCTWPAPELDGEHDCYVAFFGGQFPPAGHAPPRPPYVLRYASIALRPAPT